MLDTAIAKLATYDGTNPADVRDALARRFKASSSAFAMWITFNLRFLRVLAPRSEYVCQKVYYDCGGLCQEEAPYAWAPICGALAPVRVCDPRYFGAGDTDRPMYLIHEWVHKYGCNFDLGYCSESDCPGGTVRSLLNADPWARLVGDIARTAKRSRLDGCRRARHPGHRRPPQQRRKDRTFRGCPDFTPASRQSFADRGEEPGHGVRGARPADSRRVVISSRFARYRLRVVPKDPRSRVIVPCHQDSLIRCSNPDQNYIRTCGPIHG